MIVDRLAGLEPRELRFLEVRVDIDVGERHQAGEALAGLHEVADLHGAVADTPSTGARITVNDRSRSALASAVCNSSSVRAASCCCALSTSTLAMALSSAAFALRTDALA